MGLGHRLEAMERRTFLRVAGLAGVAGVAGCLDRRTRAAPSYDVGMSTVEFLPAEISVAAGETVVWRNTSSHAHTVTAYEDGLPAGAAFFATGDFESRTAAEAAWDDRAGGALYQGETYSHAFSQPGTYPYYCIPHESSGMTGTVVVE